MWRALRRKPSKGSNVMSFRFRRSFKIAPGLRLNVDRKSLSVRGRSQRLWADVGNSR
ncbi:DUF4236 domain-containing protein [Mesorhizobium sp. M7D.F.Ca.US.005.01.1.1]|nr:DUF4236 domain-containing protein [Mesorhizobium sp. M7D.F.Ca.US.005.01.1.1]